MNTTPSERRFDINKVEVTISDAGFTVTCDSTTVINRIKDEARKIGGNAVCITEHKKPSFWGSSCHQMTAIILKVKDFAQSNDSIDNSVKELTEVQNAIMKPVLPKFKIGANIGYGWRRADLGDLEGDQRDFYKKMMSGIIWDGSFHYYFNDTYGLGLLYYSYSASNSIYAQMTAPVIETGMLNSKTAITFIGPAFVMRAATNDRKWFLNLSMGVGYLGYYIKETINNHYSKEEGATAGLQWSAGGEYKFSNHWGISADFTMITGLVNKTNINIDGNKTVEKYEQGSGIGLGQFRLTTGLRYYFK